MNKLMIVLAGLALAAGPALADNAWGLYGSYWSPSDGSGSFGPGAKVSIEMIPGVLLDLRVSHYDNVADNGPELEVLPIEAGLSMTAPLADRLSVYGGAGVGYYLLDSDAQVDDEFGFYAAGGVEFAVIDTRADYGATRGTLFAEVFYRNAEAGFEGGGDMSLDGVGINAGLMIRW